MMRLFCVVAFLLILVLCIPAIFGRMSGHDKFVGGGSESIKSRSTYRGTLVKGDKAISGLVGHNLVAATNRRADNVDGLLVAASDYEGDVVVVAGEYSQLYVFKKKKDAYLLDQVLWDGKTNAPVSLAITENARYAVMMTSEITTLPGIGNAPDSILRSVGRNLPPREMKKPLLIIWDLEKEEIAQEINTQRLGIASNDALVTAGRTLVMKRSFFPINADLSGMKNVQDAYLDKPGFIDERLWAQGAYRQTQASYAPLTRQILVKNSAKNNFLRYKVLDESRDKWWKFWSSEVSLEKLPGDFLACPSGAGDCALDTLFPAFEISPDGKFFVIWRDDGMLEAYSLPNGILLSKIRTGKRMNTVAAPHLTIVDGTVYLTNGENFSAGNNESSFWSWKPGDTELRAHYLQCADYTRLLNNGYIATLGCRDRGMELRLVALTNNSRAQTFSQPLRLQ